MKSIRIQWFPLLFFLAFCFGLKGQTVGLIEYDAGVEDGYVLFSPLLSDNTYLIDNCGRYIHNWQGNYPPGMAGYLLEDGSLLRAGKTPDNYFIDNRGGGGVIERIASDGSIMWSYAISDETQLQHHDLELLPNGNFLAIVWEKKTVEEAIAAGRNPDIIADGGIWSEKIVEIQPDASATGGTVVWEWRAWDHLVQDFDSAKPNYGTVADAPHKIDLNYEKIGFDVDWLHINGLDYNAELDQIVLSVHDFDEIWIIDRGTTTEEAAGPAGDLLYRWGNPLAYDRGILEDKRFFGQHDARWVPEGYPNAGRIMAYNNGNGRPGPDYSSVDMIIPPLNGEGKYDLDEGEPYGPQFLDWDYSAPNPSDFFSLVISGAEPLPNGNVLVCEGTPGRFFEVDILGNKLWEYVNPISLFGPIPQGSTDIDNSVFICSRILPEHAGLSSLDLTPGDPLELNPLNYECFTSSISENIDNEEIRIHPNPTNGMLHVEFDGVLEELVLLDVQGRVLMSDVDLGDGYLDLSGMDAGFYFIKIKTKQRTSVHKLLLMH